MLDKWRWWTFSQSFMRRNQTKLDFPGTLWQHDKKLIFFPLFFFWYALEKGELSKKYIMYVAFKKQEYPSPYSGVCHGRISSASLMTHNHSLFSRLPMHSPLNTCMLAHSRNSICLTGTSGWACFSHARVCRCAVFNVKLNVQGSKFFPFIRADWCWQRWRTWNRRVRCDSPAKRPLVGVPSPSTSAGFEVSDSTPWTQYGNKKLWIKYLKPTAIRSTTARWVQK